MPPTTGRAPRILLTSAAVVIALGGCAVARPLVAGPTEATTAAPAPPSAGAAGDAWLVVGAPGEAGLRVVLASTREELLQLPMGVPNETWGEVVAATPGRATTTVDRITVQPDLPARTQSLDGSWRLPTLGNDALPVGVSEDGSTIVLVEDGAAAGSATTRFAVITKDAAARIIEVPGAFEYDTLSPDGSILYVVEHLAEPPDGHYQVRALDVPTGVLRDEVIVDKRNLEASMAGWPITQLRHDGGVVFTLYRGTGHTFIHALNSREAWAICLGLPMIGADDEEAAADWGLGQTADGRVVYAVNATLGLAVAIDPGDLSIRATARFDAPSAAAAISLAKFGHQDTGPVGRRVAITPDGSTIYAAGGRGIVRIAADDLTLMGHVLEGAAVDALAMTLDGTSLFALLPREDRIARIDLSSGQIAGYVPGDGFDRLVAIVPW